ncbi:MAG: dUTP diphosphatase [Thermoleophilia bacterium]
MPSADAGSRPATDPAVGDRGAEAAEHGREVRVQLIHDQARMPVRAYDHDAAYDLCAAEEVVIPPQERALVSTGLVLGLPHDLAALTLPRSGLAARHGITLVNAPGLIDPGYRGEVRLIVLNTDTRESFVVHAGDRIAQLLFTPVTSVRLELGGDLDTTQRGERGFGSSGHRGGKSG